MTSVSRMAAVVATSTLLAGAALSQERLEFDSEGSSMEVSGTSTLHDWTCQVEKLAGWIDQAAASSASRIITAARLEVAVSDIECGKRVMNRKLRDALQADRAPAIIFQSTTVRSDGEELVGEGSLEIAGASHQATVRVRVQEAESGVRLIGVVELDLTELGIPRPKALMGSVKTGRLITVTFDVWAR